MERTFFLVATAAIIGIALGSGIQSRWTYGVLSQLDASSTATLVAGLGGAAVGGLVSLGLTLISNYVTLRRDREARIENEQALALELISTQLQLSGRCYTIFKAVDSAIRAAPDNPWTALRPTPRGSSPSLRFRSDSFIPFINAGAAELMNDCLLYADRVDALEAMFNSYSDQRLEMQSMAEANTVIGEDVQGETVFEGAAARVAEFRSKLMNDLIKQMHEVGAAWTEEGAKIAEKVNRVQRQYFGARSRIDMKVAVPDSQP
ncbi:hypothetical protein [Pelagibacterium sp. H642]|uniref:hypothetical protein n=1 Tax=Pelagibacterium sp. H642 TaxID=1881069 RepID=UPI002814E1C1|nr:hypothetical protein [Pelagibacterium sp. H642]WMT90135.1 hypothetical protein NO934_15255 [Pelagibacterium sp. H642]